MGFFLGGVIFLVLLKSYVYAEQLCDAPFSFERVPQHVLVGYALEVFRSRTLSDCLRSCLDSVKTFRIECKSAMYYYETQECILNREDRQNRPDLFTSDSQGFIVDYFDNNCAGTQCFAPQVLQYSKTESATLNSQKNLKLVNINRETCQHFCDVNQVLASSQICGGVTAFTRVPMRVLVGFAREVSEMPSLLQCLDSCISAKNKKGFPCKSLMYYYNTSECLLNTESRSTRPELFSTDTQGFMVDYFENNCHNSPGLCPKDYDRIYVKVENAELSGHDTSGRVSGLSVVDCAVRCTEETQYTCRSIDYSVDTCSWSYQDTALISLSKAPTTPTTYYEARCIEDASACGSFFYGFEYKKNREFRGFVASTVSGISSATCLSMCLQNKGVSGCLSANYDTLTSTCELNSANCRSAGAHHLRQRTGVDYYENQCTSVPLDCKFREMAHNQRPRPIYRLDSVRAFSAEDCQKICEQKLEFPCRSVAYDVTSGICDLSDVHKSKPPETDPGFLEPAPGFRYFEKGICKGSSVSVDCRFDGTKVRIEFPQQISGSIFVKNRYWTCREDFKNTTSATLNIPFPGAEPSTGPAQGLDGNRNCDGSEIAPNVFSYTIVVQKNEFGVPSLMTSMDQMFNATCDYTQQLLKVTVHAATAANVGFSGTPNLVKNLFGKTNVDISQAIHLHILRDGKPVRDALLGEECELFWEIGDTAPPGMGYFVRDCQAERLGGNPPDPEPLKLITNGCPDQNMQRKLITEPVRKVENGFSTKMIMFRFDGSRSVKLRCIVDMCLIACPEAHCIDNGISWGRKKRQSWTYYPNAENQDFQVQQGIVSNSFSLANEPKNDQNASTNTVVEKGTVSGIFRIVDSLPLDTSGGQHGFGLDGASLQALKNFYKKGKVCMVRPLFISIFTFMSLFCIVEGIFVLVFCWRKFQKGPPAFSYHSETGWETSTAATTKGHLTNQNTLNTHPRGSSRSSGYLSTLQDWQAYADRKLARVGENLRRRASLLPSQFLRKAPPTSSQEKQQPRQTNLIQESSSDIYPSDDGRSTNDSRKKLTKTRPKNGQRPRSRPSPNVLLALPEPVDTSSECGSGGRRSSCDRQVSIHIETFRSNPEVIFKTDPLYENAKCAPPLPPKPKGTCTPTPSGNSSPKNQARPQEPPPLPPRSGSSSSSNRSRSTLDGVKQEWDSDVGGQLTPTPTPSLKSSGGGSGSERKVRFEEFPPPPPNLQLEPMVNIDRGYRSHEFRNNSRIQLMAQEIHERAIWK